MITYREAIIIAALFIAALSLLVLLRRAGRRSSVAPLSENKPRVHRSKERTATDKHTPALDLPADHTCPRANYGWHILPWDSALHEQAVDMLEGGWKYDSRQVESPREIGGSYMANGLPSVPPRRLK